MRRTQPNRRQRLKLSEGQSGLDTLLQGTATLGLDVDLTQRELFVRYAELLLDVNMRMNLTALRDPVSVMRSLFLDSLTLTLALPAENLHAEGSVRLVDVGSGAGIPGVPLKILFPHWSLVLVESVSKKARFLRELVSELGLKNVAVVNARAEELGWESAYRDSAQLACARAVATIATLLELCAPLTAPGGHLLFPKSGDVAAEIKAGGQAARALGVQLRGSVEVPTTLGLGAERAIVSYRKTTSTPAGYPRRVGLPKSRPIGQTVRDRASIRVR